MSMGQHTNVSTGTGVTLKMTLDTSFLKQWEAFSLEFPFALSLALNRTGKLAGKHLRETLGNYFTIRNKWTAGGIGLPKADSKDAKGRPTSTKWASKDRLSVEIGAAQEYMRAQTKGIDDHTRPEGKTPIGLVPASGLRAAMGGKLSRRGDWARGLIRTGKAVRVSLLSTRREAIIATAKFGHGWEEGRPLYFPRLDKETTLDERWPMLELIQGTFGKHWADEGVKAIKHAVKTSKKYGKQA